MKNRNKKLNIAIWMMIIVTTLLLLLTGGVLAMRYGNFLPSDADVIFLVPRTPSLFASDENVDWDDTDSIDIFKTEYKNENGDITVYSPKDDSVIAPGTQGSYTFYLKNEGNVALDYKVSFTAKLTADDIRVSATDFPFLFRMSNQHGDYTVGSEETWVTVDELNEIFDDGIVGKNSYYYYTLEWFWPFESGNDGMDTYFGNLSDQKDVILSLNISSYAEESMNPDGVGGDANEGEPSPDVGTINPFMFFGLVALTLAAIVLLIYLLYQRFVKKKKNFRLKELAITMTGVGSALSVMYYKMFHKKKK